MKKAILCVLVMLLTFLPVSVFAWPTVLHDDGGPYADLAVAAAGSLVATAVLTPTSIELTVLDSTGERQAWSAFALPENVWAMDKQNISLQLYPDNHDNYRIMASLVAGDLENIISAVIFSGDVVIQGETISIIPHDQPTAVIIPPGAKDMEVLPRGRFIYLIWRIATEDNISTVLINRFNRLPPTTACLMYEI